MKKWNVLLQLFTYGFLLFSTPSCELFGLEFQYDYQNKTAPVQKELGMSCYEFIESRNQVDFCLLYEAIMRAEMQAIYETNDLTFFLLPDDQFADYLLSWRYESLQSVPKTVLQEMLQRYIIPGIYSVYELSHSYTYVTTLNGTTVIRMYIPVRESTASQNINGIYAGWVQSDGRVNNRGAFPGNLRPTNGIIHILTQRF